MSLGRGKPAIIFLEADNLPLQAKAMCVLGEIVDDKAGSGGQACTRVNFVTIVTVVASVADQGAVFSFNQVPEKKWLLL